MNSENSILRSQVEFTFITHTCEIASLHISHNFLSQLCFYPTIVSISHNSDFFFLAVLSLFLTIMRYNLGMLKNLIIVR